MPGQYFIPTAVMDLPFAQVCYLPCKNCNSFICGDGLWGSGLRLRQNFVCNIIKKQSNGGAKENILVVLTTAVGYIFFNERI
jgi:hypothetical protein